MTVTIKVNSVIQIPAGPETAVLIPRIRAVMEYERRKRAGDWLGGTNSTIRASTLSPQGLTVPRGALDIVTDIAQRCGVDVRWGQQTGIEVLAGSHLQWPAVRHDLRPYQIGAIDAAATRMQGVIVAPCGAGKTQIGVGLTAYLGVRTLVLVHMRDLMDQWVAQYKAMLPAIEVGIIGGGVYDPREITVAMVQTATKNRYMLKRFDLVILDEAHHCPARTFRAVMDHCPARYRIGLTATPHRADGLTELLYWTMGPVICEVRHAELIAGGYKYTVGMSEKVSYPMVETIEAIANLGGGEWGNNICKIDPVRLKSRLDGFKKTMEPEKFERLEVAIAMQATRWHTPRFMARRVETAK